MTEKQQIYKKKNKGLRFRFWTSNQSLIFKSTSAATATASVVLAVANIDLLKILYWAAPAGH